MQHKREFGLGSKVEWIRTPSNVQRGLYKVVGLMPEGADGEFQYRIKSDAEVVDRVVTETQI